MHWLRRVDRGWARFEEITVLALFATLLVAYGAWAIALRVIGPEDLHFISSPLPRRLTFCLAMFGLSLAAYRDRHASLRLVERFAPEAARRWVLVVRRLIAGVICLGLAYSACDTVMRYLLDEPPCETDWCSDARLEARRAGRPDHICDFDAAALSKLEGVKRPVVLCASRAALGALGMPNGQPHNVTYFIMPLELLVVALRFLAYGVSAARGARRVEAEA